MFSHVFVEFLCLYLNRQILNQIKKGGDDGAPVVTGAVPETLKVVRGGDKGGETDHRGAKAAAKAQGETGTQYIP